MRRWSVGRSARRAGCWRRVGAPGLKTEPWYDAGRKPLLKQSMPAGRDQAAVEDDEAGQVLALAAQPVGHPGAMAGPALEAAAGVQEVVGAGVLGEVRDHRPDDRQVVDACRATCGNRSLTGMPLSPYWRNFQGLLSTLPTLLNWVGWVFTLIGWPCSRSSRGLGSNVSTCDGPPSMYRKMTLRALAGKWPGRGRQRAGAGVRRRRRASAPKAGSRSSAARASAPKPLAQRSEHLAADSAGVEIDGSAWRSAADRTIDDQSM